jgi:Xaa-Pro aminopeptidase
MMALRQVKSEAEVACLREAFRIAEVAVDCVLKSIRPGMTELQVVGIVQRIIYEHGAESEGMPQYVLSGRKTNQAISRPTHKVMQKGELVQLNLSARVDGYSSGVGRPLCLGKMSGHMRELVEFGKLAHERTFGCLRAGVSASAVAADYRRFFIDSGRGGNYLYGPCHGLGMMECEPPWMEEGKDYPLAAGMTFQIDTFVQDADLGLRWENGSLITTDSAELFSNRHMEILELG